MNKQNKSFFSVCAEKYVIGKDFYVKAPASLSQPHDNAVMFLMKKYSTMIEALYSVKECLIFWDQEVTVPNELIKRHAIFTTTEPRLTYCKFFRENGIRYYPMPTRFNMVNGAMICEGAVLGQNCIVMPGAYIGAEVEIGDNAYIGAGAKLVSRITAGSNVVIRENTVIGADGLSTDRDENGHAVTMPQFGGVWIGDNVEIGACTIIARGAIDDTVIESGTKVDNSVFVSHNVHLGNDTFIVGESILFGGSSTGARAFISGNATVRNKILVGEDATVGMGAVVTKNVSDGAVVLGNPAKDIGVK